MTPAAELDAAHEVVRRRLEGWVPDVAIVLGSGLGGLAGEIEARASIPFDAIPGLRGTGVEGHAGHLVAGDLGGTRVIAFAGRLHYYEGHPLHRVVMSVRLASMLGATALLVTNAAGGIRRTLRPGTLMLLRDHINLAFRSPLAGPVFEDEERFPDLSAPYDWELAASMREAARASGVLLEEGVYAWVLGPSYETPAEIRMLERIGADAVGMSTVPEVLVAVARGMRVCAVSCITNAAGAGAPVDHREVLDVAARVRADFGALVKEWAKRRS